MEGPTAGTSCVTISDGDDHNTQIPTVLNETQREITSLIERSHDARKKAEGLLEKAKRAIATTSEEGEDHAIEFLSADNAGV